MSDDYGALVREESVSGYSQGSSVVTGPDHPDAEGFAELVHTLRRLQTAVSSCAPPAEVSIDLTDRLRSAVEQLENHLVPETQRFVGGAAVSGPGHPLLVPYEVTGLGERKLSATVQFTEFHLGGNGAVHGGAIPLLFDDLLGTFVSVKGRSPSRTAFLTVNYRRITPINRRLQIEATIDSIQGRKSSITGRLYDGEALVVDAEALFVQLRQGQP